MGQSMGREVSEQNLHHFVNSSTWDWWAVRRDLTSYLTSAHHPAAWVVTPMLIPKAGVHSVGWTGATALVPVARSTASWR